MNPGKITETQCKRSVLKWLPSNGRQVIQGAGIGRDYAGMQITPELGWMTASATVTMGTQEAVTYAFWKAQNQWATSGGTMQAITAILLLPARGSEERIRKTVQTITELCVQAGIEYLGGHTELLENLRYPSITITAYGIQTKQTQRFTPEAVQAGDSIYMLGYAALEATSMLVNDHWQELKQRYADFYLETARDCSSDLSLVSALQELHTDGITYLHDVSTGGVFAALWELGEAAGCGMQIEWRKIPIRQETIEVCEFFDVNPYMAMSGGSMLAVVKKSEKLQEQRIFDRIPVVRIGQVTATHDRIVVRDEESRYLTLPKGDELYKIYKS